MLDEARDGRVWRFEPKTDYECSDQAFRQHVRQYAERHNLDFGFQPIKDGRRTTFVEIAFVPKGTPLPAGLPAGDADPPAAAPEAA